MRENLWLAFFFSLCLLRLILKANKFLNRSAAENCVYR